MFLNIPNISLSPHPNSIHLDNSYTLPNPSDDHNICWGIPLNDPCICWHAIDKTGHLDFRTNNINLLFKLFFIVGVTSLWHIHMSSIIKFGHHMTFYSMTGQHVVCRLVTMKAAVVHYGYGLCLHVCTVDESTLYVFKGSVYVFLSICVT